MKIKTKVLTNLNKLDRFSRARLFENVGNGFAVMYFDTFKSKKFDIREVSNNLKTSK